MISGIFQKIQNGAKVCGTKKSPNPLDRGAGPQNGRDKIFTSPNLTQPGINSTTKFKGTGRYWLHAALSFVKIAGFRGWSRLGAVVDNLIMPHDFDGELGLLNACFCPGGIKRIIDLVEPSDFYSDGGRLIFAKMVAFHRAGLEPTLFQVDTAFQDHQNYINIRSILDALLPFTAEDATHYAKIVKRLSDRRRAIKQAYATYLDLHDLANPLPSDVLQPIMAGGANG